MQTFDDWLSGLSAEYVEALYHEYRRDPSLLTPQWREFFERLGEGNGVHLSGHYGRTLQPSSIFNPRAAMAERIARPPSDGDLAISAAQHRVDQLIRAFRVRGHLAAKIDPLGLARPDPPELNLSFFHLSEADLDRPFSASSIGGPSTQTLRDIVKRLRNTYCRTIAAQFMHIDDLHVRDWLSQTMEETQNRLELDHEEQTRILTRLTDAVIFEQFVRKKYVGAKTFSLEGGESLIPLLHLAIERAGKHGLDEIVLGMAHRGRLNVLVNILRKTPGEMFAEFEDVDPERHHGRGDVKYHLGYSSDWVTADGRTLHLSLCFNPSHLEFVNPVALGRTRAKQDRAGDTERQRCMTLLIHGDAAFAGEGIVQETLNFSQLSGYKTGGTLHVVVNNQLGFTTPPNEGRSSTYATDVAKMLQIPIFHVNGEDPEAVAQVVNLAMEFRRRFARDVVIDMYCYRKRGHNESDEPTFTQPVMYEEIESRDSVRDNYLERLLMLGKITVQEAEEIDEQRYKKLEEHFARAKRREVRHEPQTLTGIWKGYCGGEEPADDDVNNGVPREQLAELLEKMTEAPDDLHVHSKLQKSLERWREMAAGERPVDWPAAELLALASLAVQGHRVRLSGQDCIRGTFSQRHAMLYDSKDGHAWHRLANLSPDQAPVEIINSPLSEAGVLGFEYGYSLDWPEGLVLWEAQFGDFVNAAQVIIDQFIASAEDKWRRLSGLVLLLPHGFEGQGPEHSSARLERFLMQAAEHNMQIAQPSTPAQYFHLLCRQVRRHWRKPLVVMTPKSLLRHPQVVSSLEELAEGRFRRVLPDERERQEHTTRILLCSGKMYFELADWRQQHERDDVAIVRLEQYYPLPVAQLREALREYTDGTPAYWVQEEPENMGAWRFLQAHFGNLLLGCFPLQGICRPESASPATGSHASHKLTQQQLWERAFSSGSSEEAPGSTG